MTDSTVSTSSNAQPQLRTRAECLANGLVPTTVDEDFECSISLCNPDEPVKIPCGHIFDKVCIVQNLNQRRVNKCPLCRKELFALPMDESLRPNAGRQALVGQAVQRVFANVDQGSSMYRALGFDEPTESGLARGIANARVYLVHTPDPANGQAIGPAIVRSDYLAPRIVAMANLIPALAALSGRGYSSMQLARWSSIIDILREDIDDREGDMLDAIFLPRQLRAAIRRELKEARLDWRQDPFAAAEVIRYWCKLLDAALTIDASRTIACVSKQSGKLDNELCGVKGILVRHA
ncbi:hypothetical protein LTR78_002345 [Recurvomyces mirabilis]|uniref:peptidylprolyl isomerase n=1 Tax=Recurvomyces mirabilis TaxID=574656 RepID=A0AAE0WTV3_9PEZI|nr:hypothetical protein LTR78_002345 [Recurvomyces mirabilis]KAK5157274.1 hypothetical protein LTS14_004039 [Recurvomyces mirabilis]